jgi:hypothetical protein
MHARPLARVPRCVTNVAVRPAAPCWRVVLSVTVVAAALLTSCSSQPTTSGAAHSPSAVGPIPKLYPARVALYGDSLSLQAEPYFKRLMAAEDTSNTTVYSSHGGTATCDWLATMRKMAATAHFEAVLLEFSGNALTRCMAHVGYYTPAYYAKYAADTMAAIAIWVPTGAHVFLIGAPVTRQQQESVPDWDALDLLYAQIAAADPRHVTYVDAGAAVEGPGGTYALTLPCSIGEPCTGPVVDGVPSNVVRSPDGVHFCPVAEVRESCPVYSAGALRFAAAMVHGLVTAPGPGAELPQGSAG